MAAKDESSQNTARTLYVNTNLHTNFAMRVLEEDTIAELKQKISLNHQHCFPQAREITVGSVKVRRRGCFYHVMDTMLLKHIFEGEGKNNGRWFLNVEAAFKQFVSAQKPLYLGAATQPPVPVVATTAEDGGRTKKRKIPQAAEVPKPGDVLDVVETDQVTSKRRRKKSKEQLHANDVHEREQAFDADDSLVVVETEVTQKKRRKKSKKGMDANDADEREQTFSADVNERVEFSKPVDSSVVVKMALPQKKSSKKSKKDVDADPKVQLQANDADDTAKGDEQVGSAENDVIEVEKILVHNDDPGMIPETTDSTLKSKDLDASAKFADGTGDIVAQDPSDKRKKKSKKDVDADSKEQLRANDADHREQTFDADNINGVEFSKPVDSSVVVNTEAPQKKRKKKSKKSMDADSKAELHANDADDTSKHEQTFDADVHTVKVHKENSITTQLESRQNLEVCCAGGQVGLAENDMIEVEKVLVQNDPKMIPETTYTKLKTADLDVSAKSADATGNILAQYPSETRKKKVKKIKNSDAKINVSAAQLENVEGADDTLAVQGHPGVEPQIGDAILCATEGVNASKVESLNTPAGISVNNDYQEGAREDTSPNKAKIIRDQETTEKIIGNAKLKSVKAPPASNTVADQGMKQQVEAQVSLDMRKKKAKKTKNSRAKNDISTSGGEHVEGACDALVVQNHPVAEPEKIDIILSDIKGVKALNLERLNTLAEVSLNTDYQGSGREDHVVPKTDNPDLVIPVEQLGEMGFHQRKREKELERKKETKMPNVDPTCIISDLEIPQESVDKQVIGTRTQPGSSEISKLQKMRIEANPSKKALLSAGAVHSSSKIPRVAATKPGSKKTREVGSQKGKNLLAASDTIFDQSSSESSADSDASTLSPSDTSSSSDQSEGEGLDSPRNGFYVRTAEENGGTAEENGGNNSSKPQDTAKKNMDLDSIIRSSRSYRKAKFTASQSQHDDSESEAIQCDLDSQF